METGLFTLCSHSTAHTIPYPNYNIYNIILYHSTNYGITVQDLLLIYCVFCSFNNNHNAQQQQPTTNNLQPTTTTTNEIPQLNFWKYLKNKTRSCTLRAVAIWYGAKIKIIVYIHIYYIYYYIYIYIYMMDNADWCSNSACFVFHKKRKLKIATLFIEFWVMNFECTSQVWNVAVRYLATFWLYMHRTTF